MSSPDFDAIKHLNPYMVEYWEARELQPLPGYHSSWQNFEKVIKKGGAYPPETVYSCAGGYAKTP